MQRGSNKLSSQIKVKVKEDSKMRRAPKLEGNTEMMISTGSTLLDLAISGGRVRGGGIPAGIFVEVFGPSGSGKTVLLCEIAGAISRKNGEIKFMDPEARLNNQFAEMFGFKVEDAHYTRPDTVPQVFEPVREWKPKSDKVINGIFADSLAALSTDMEMEGTDKYGMRRAKEFSEELRKTCRILKQNNFLMVASNQLRTNIDAGMFGPKHRSPGGEAIGYYSSLRLKYNSVSKIKKKVKFAGKAVERVVGVETVIEVHKSSVWKPYRTAPVTIIFDYGIDDIRQNLQFVKDYKAANQYCLNGESISQSMTTAIAYIEDNELENELKNEVIDLWEEIDKKFEEPRKLKRR